MCRGNVFPYLNQGCCSVIIGLQVKVDVPFTKGKGRHKTKVEVLANPQVPYNTYGKPHGRIGCNIEQVQ